MVEGKTSGRGALGVPVKKAVHFAVFGEVGVVVVVEVFDYLFDEM